MNSASRARRRAALVLAAGLCVTALIAISALLTGRLGVTAGRVLLSTLAAALCTLTGVTGSDRLEHLGLCRRLGEATIALSAVDLALALIMIWIPGATNDDSLGRTLAIAVVLTLATSHAGAMFGHLRPRDGAPIVALTRLAVAFAAVASLLFSGMLASADGGVDPWLWRLLGVLVVLAMLCTGLVPLARKISPGQTRDAPPSPPPPNPPGPAGTPL